MCKALIPAFLLVLGSVVLGATAFRDQIVRAATTPFQNVIVTNTSTNPVPVDVQNADASGTLRVHEQGTANVSVQGTPNVNVTNASTSPVPVAEQGTSDVNVTNTSPVPIHEQGTADVNVVNSSLSVAQPEPIRDGGYAVSLGANPTGEVKLATGHIATALVIHITSGVSALSLWNDTGEVAVFYGPDTAGVGDVVLPLNRPISFNAVWCDGTSGNCTIGTVGDLPLP